MNGVLSKLYGYLFPEVIERRGQKKIVREYKVLERDEYGNPTDWQDEISHYTPRIVNTGKHKLRWLHKKGVK